MEGGVSERSFLEKATFRLHLERQVEVLPLKKKEKETLIEE
jgi:hypothetical protein